MDSLKLSNELLSIFPYYDEEPDCPEEDFLLVDPANICGVYGKTKEIKKVLMRFVARDLHNLKNLTKFNYEGKYELGGEYSIDFIKKIFEILHALGEEPKIYCSKDYPIKLEGKSIGFILAPRIYDVD